MGGEGGGGGGLGGALRKVGWRRLSGPQAPQPLVRGRVPDVFVRVTTGKERQLPLSH